MAWKLDNPLYSLADEDESRKIIELWEAEKPGGMWEGNNRLPFPFTFLIALIVLTAFLVTMPIWGQRPSAEIFKEHVRLMDSPQVAALATPEEKMAFIHERAMQLAQTHPDPRTEGLIRRHPITWDDLLLIAPQIREIQASGGSHDLDEYNIIGDRVLLANFQGQIFMGKGELERRQPWWDNGYTIDVFYVSYFVIVMVIVCKRLPHFSRKPNMARAT